MSHIITTPGELIAIRPAWLELWTEDSLSTVFNHPDWHLSFIHAMDHKPFRAIVSKDSLRLRYIWLLQGNERRMGFLSEPLADYARPSIAKGVDCADAVRGLLAALRDQRTPLVVLNEFQFDDPLPELIARTAPEFGYSANVSDTVACPRMSRAREPGIFEQKFLGSRKLRRVLSELRKTGDLNYERIANREQILGHLPALFAMHTARWAGTGQTVFLSPRIREFFVALVKTMPEELLYFTRLRQDGKAVAMDLDFTHGGCLYYYKPAFDVNIAERSPGLAHMCQLGLDIMQQGFHTLDFTRGDEPYKLRFANEIVRNRRVMIYRGYASRATFQIAESLRRGVIRDPVRRQRLKYTVLTARAAVAKYGIFGLARRTIDKAYKKRIRSRSLLLFKIAKPSGPDEAGATDVLVRRGSHHDILAVTDLVDHVDAGRHVKTLWSRLGLGDELYLGYSNGALVHAAWVARRERVYATEIRRELRVGEKTAYIYDCFTAPKARGRGIYPTVLKHIMRHLFAVDGIDSVAIACPGDNAASRRGIERAGFTLEDVIRAGNQPANRSLA